VTARHTLRDGPQKKATPNGRHEPSLAHLS
jgi:hypothetical protein